MEKDIQSYKNHINNSDKAIVLVSSGFLQTYNSCTNRKLGQVLVDNYSVLGYDNSGHGEHYHLPFKVDNQLHIFNEILNTTDKPIHIIANSIPGLYALFALEKMRPEYRHKQIKTLTILAPALNTGDALDVGFQKKNSFIQWCYKYGVTRKVILSPLLKALKGVNSNLDELYKWSHEPDRYSVNKELLSTLNQIIPIHLVYNRGDIVVCPNDKEEQFQEYLDKNGITYSCGGSDRENRHIIYPNEDRVKETNMGKDTLGTTIGSTIKEFIQQYD